MPCQSGFSSGGPSMSPSPTAQPRVYQADALKGAAILAVLALRSARHRDAPHESRVVPHLAGGTYPVRPSGTRECRTRVHPLGAATSGEGRGGLGMPFAIAWVVSLGIALLRRVPPRSAPLLLAGVLPASGPGNYFITLLFQYVLLLPVLRWLFDEGPWVGALSTFAASLAFELEAHASWDSSRISTPRARSATSSPSGLGMWLATDGYSVLPDRIAEHRVSRGLRTRIRVSGSSGNFWQPQNLVGFGYAAALVEAGLHYLPCRKESPLARLGTASYHIFLVQIL